jgi:hypothetical protein
MSVAAWVGLYAVHTLWWLWVAKVGVPSWLVDPLAHRWGSEGIRIFAFLWIAAGTAWFLLGLFDPKARGSWPESP